MKGRELPVTLIAGDLQRRDLGVLLQIAKLLLPRLHRLLVFLPRAFCRYVCLCELFDRFAVDMSREHLDRDGAVRGGAHVCGHALADQIADADVVVSEVVLKTREQRVSRVDGAPVFAQVVAEAIFDAACYFFLDRRDTARVEVAGVRVEEYELTTSTRSALSWVLAFRPQQFCSERLPEAEHARVGAERLFQVRRATSVVRDHDEHLRAALCCSRVARGRGLLGRFLCGGGLIVHSMFPLKEGRLLLVRFQRHSKNQNREEQHAGCSFCSTNHIQIWSALVCCMHRPSALASYAATPPG